MSWWKSHGTKILGTATAAVGVLGTVDPTVLASTLGPKGISVLTGVAGILTILRGFQNTANQLQEPPTIR
jgi:hypothetical protein